MVAEQQQRRPAGSVEQLERARLVRREETRLRGAPGCPAGDLEGRHEAPTIAAGVVAGKALQVLPEGAPRADRALPKAKAAPILRPMSEASEASQAREASAAAVRPNTFFCIDGHTCGNPVRLVAAGGPVRSEEHTSELQSLMRNSYAVFC